MHSFVHPQHHQHHHQHHSHHHYHPHRHHRDQHHHKGMDDILTEICEILEEMYMHEFINLHEGVCIKIYIWRDRDYR